MSVTPRKHQTIPPDMQPPRYRALRGKSKVFEVHDIHIHDVDDDRVTIVIHGRRRSAVWPDISRALKHPEQKPRLREIYLAISETGQALLEEKRHLEILLRQRASIVEVGPDADVSDRWRVYLEGWIPRDLEIGEDDAESFGIYEDAALQAEHTSRRLEKVGVRVIRQFDLEEDLRRRWFPHASTPSLDGLGAEGTIRARTGIHTPYAWVEYPLWAENENSVHDALLNESVCRREPGRNDQLVRLVSFRPRGRFPVLEEALRGACIPYDIGGEDGFDGLGWSGWWRPGCDLPRVFDVAANGETMVGLDEIRELRQAPSDKALRRAIEDLIEQHDRDPATDLTMTQPRLRLIG